MIRDAGGRPKATEAPEGDAPGDASILRVHHVAARRHSRHSDEPARIRSPRIAFVAVTVGLCLFGLLMTYSASSIEALVLKGSDPAFFLFRQGVGCLVGTIACLVISCIDYRRIGHVETLLLLVLEVALLALVLVPSVGQSEYGASRRIDLGPFDLQPSEFAKPVLILVGARLWVAALVDKANPVYTVLQTALGIGVPLGLILYQPDKGTTAVIAVTLLVMAYFCGMRMRFALFGLGAGGVALLVHSLIDEYARERILTMLDPFRDQYDKGYQLVQGFYALGSGGLFGVGLGLARAKYRYLPMAYNDFILAIIGEELGMVGTVGLMLAFCVLLWSGYRIAQSANDMFGRLIAGGCTTVLFVQMLLNVGGVIGMLPLSGKPIPFVSYGGSSVLSSLMLVGMVLSVSLHTELPQTRYDERRSRMRIADDEPLTRDAGMPEAVPMGVRHARTGEGQDVRDAGSTRQRAPRSNLRVLEGGLRGNGAIPAADLPELEVPEYPLAKRARREPDSAGRAAQSAMPEKAVRSHTRDVRDPSGHTRIDLGPTPTDRLRSRRRGDG